MYGILYFQLQIYKATIFFFNQFFMILCIPSIIIAIFHGNMTYTSIKVTISGYFSGIISLYAIFKAFDGISINLNDLKNIVKYFFLGMLPTSFS